uniref:putative RING-H2 finger protein ATL21A n=1 Tax=Fragaria vesca subsp. vesca TaxID=101020 RepID=UPI0005C94007|nr:PREDICTED: putative RING-H2 finger protein ATL21A [Fragaria vesca subsp. vesca]
MAALNIFITFFFFLFFFLPHITAATCPRSTCTSHSPSIRFPFRLANQQKLSNSGYLGFDLSRNNQKQTILTLPSSGDFVVQNINYKEQIVTINNPENCLPKLFLDGNYYFNLTDSPFTFLTDIRNYTFLNCSTQDGTWAASIACLSDDYYKVLLVPTPRWPTSWFPCSIISTALVPIYSLQWRDLDDVLGIHLSWNEPDCRSCEAGGLRCEFQNATSSQVQCSVSSHTGLSGSAKYGIIIGVGIPGILCTLGIGLYVCDRVGRVRDGLLHQRQSITELSTAVDQQVEPAPLVIVGLDGRTIESYPNFQLDESLELPEPDDKTCSICLCEYQPKETIRIIPDCNHYFHASCIYEWLRKNPTCPLCRNPPEGLLKL